MRPVHGEQAARGQVQAELLADLPPGGGARDLAEVAVDAAARQVPAVGAAVRGLHQQDPAVGGGEQHARRGQGLRPAGPVAGRVEGARVLQGRAPGRVQAGRRAGLGDAVDQVGEGTGVQGGQPGAQPGRDRGGQDRAGLLRPQPARRRALPVGDGDRRGLLRRERSDEVDVHDQGAAERSGRPRVHRQQPADRRGEAQFLPQLAGQPRFRRLGVLDRAARQLRTGPVRGGHYEDPPAGVQDDPGGGHEWRRPVGVARAHRVGAWTVGHGGLLGARVVGRSTMPGPQPAATADMRGPRAAAGTTPAACAVPVPVPVPVPAPAHAPAPAGATRGPGGGRPS